MPFELPPGCRDLADGQASVIASWQASGAGLDPVTRKNRLRYGDWQRLQRGVYATFTGSPTREARLWAALLRAGPDAVLSHYTAAERHGLINQPSAAIHVTVPACRNPARRGKLPGVVVHRSGSILARRHPAMTPPCTRIEETVLDLIATADTFDEAYDWICRAVGRRRTTAERLRAALDARGRFPRRHETELALGDAGAGASSWLERQYVRGVEIPHGLPTAIRQARVRQGNGNRYLDNLYRDYLLCVEIDGTAAHRRTNSGATSAATAGMLSITASSPCGSAFSTSWTPSANVRPPRRSPRPCATAVPSPALRAAAWPAPSVAE